MYIYIIYIYNGCNCYVSWRERDREIDNDTEIIDENGCNCMKAAT